MRKLLKNPNTHTALILALFILAGIYRSPTTAQAPKYQPPNTLEQAIRENTRALQENTRALRSAKTGL